MTRPRPWRRLHGNRGGHVTRMDPARLRVELLEGELQRAGAVLGGSMRVLPRLRRELEGLRGERRRLRRLLRRRLQELEQTQREIEAELERAAPAKSDGVPRGSRGSRGAPAEPERGRGRHREQQRRLRRFLEIKGRARGQPARPRLKPRNPPEIPGDPPEGMGEGLEPPKNEEEEEEPWMDGPSRAFSQFLLLTEQHRELQELQQQLEQLRAAVAAAEEPPEDSGGPPGDPELELLELREQERRGREEMEELRAGLGALLAQLEEGEGQGDPPQFGDPPQDPPWDPPQFGDPLWEQLGLLEMGVRRLLLRGESPGTEVLAGNETGRTRPPPPRPPSPREDPPVGGEEEEEEGERPLSPGELREGPERGAEPRGTPPHPPAGFGGSRDPSKP